MSRVKQVEVAEQTNHDKLTKTTITKLENLAENNVKSWIEMGRVVHNFILQVTENHTKNIDGFKLLATYPQSKFTPDMLRKLEGGYLLVTEMDEKNSMVNVSMSHILAVLHGAKNYDEKVAMLKLAEEEGLSVSQLKLLAKNVTNLTNMEIDKNNPTPAKIIDYNSIILKAQRSISHCYSALSQLGMDSNKLPQDIRNSLVSLVEYVIANKLINLSEIKCGKSKDAA